ncbi:hypothetical protein AVEN_3255-1 [Araneus ventricosus]|uniref:Uncharacterized protein n=1 Tax=Araneus ventricosus TaxID=182803 RepID=A0A4Y2FLA2_ARAVE|nr:hypothetical protein AVEN_3255-1 [Araneus ventricosus]
MQKGRDGLAVRIRLRGRRFQVQNPIPLKTHRIWGILRVESYVVAKCPSSGVVWKFGEGSTSSGVALVICPRFKITRSVPKLPSD